MSRLTKPLYLALLLVVVSVSFHADNCFAKGKTIVWQGTVPVKKTFTVPKGMTLEIRPGTKVLFSKGATLSKGYCIRTMVYYTHFCAAI